MQVAKPDDLLKSNASLQTTFGIVVKLCRQHRGLTQEELAWRANLHRTYIADVERGSRNISLRNIASLAEALQVSIGHLFFCADGGLTLKPDGFESDQRGEVLFVEDNDADTELTVRALRRASFLNSIKTVTSGEAALAYLHGTDNTPAVSADARPMMVLLDLGLPGVSGMEVLRLIKSDPRTADIPVVVLTGARQEKLIKECAQLGASNYIVKPIGFSDLSRVSMKLHLSWSLQRPVAPGRGADSS